MRRLWITASAAAVLAAAGTLAAALTTGPVTTTGPAMPVSEPAPATAAVPVPGTSGDGYARNVTAGATCSPAGALGFSTQARLLRCAPGAADAQPRWLEP